MAKREPFFRSSNTVDSCVTRNTAVLPGIEAVPKYSLPVLGFIPTIEGEGMFIGTPRLLVRLSGCALKCVTCDTKYSWSVKGSKEYPALDFSVDGLAKHILREYPQYNEISITGGEPMHYPHQLKDLIGILNSHGKRVSLETSGGIIDSSVFRLCYAVSLDIKTPSSGIHLEDKTIEALISSAYLFSNVQLKCVIADETDLAFIENNFMELLDPPVATRVNGIVLTPCADNTVKEVPPSEISDIINTILNWNKSYNIRIIAQQHKLLNYL